MSKPLPVSIVVAVAALAETVGRNPAGRRAQSAGLARVTPTVR